MSDPVRPHPGQIARRSRLVALACGMVALGMVGAAFAAVPLYRAFCEATGFGGTVRRGEAPGSEARIDRTLMVRFDTNVRDIPFTFKAERLTQKVQIGAPAMAYFTVRNNSDRPITGRAVYNVEPSVAAAYFIKTQCFCFDDQTIPAYTEMRFPMIYYIEPGFAADRQTRQFEEVVLSYTYFASLNPAAAKTAAANAATGLGGTPTAGL